MSQPGFYPLRYMDMLTHPVKTMSAIKTISRVALALTLLASLGACTVIPAQHGYYRPAPVYVETYPAYGYGSSRGYYGDDHYYDRRGYGGYREQRNYQEPRRVESPLENAARVHRDIRRSLGLPRLPGMP